jgi:hypothetical protein
MCRCTPEIRTPHCGGLGCKSETSTPPVSGFPTIWKGTLALSDRILVPFDAEIVDVDGKPELIQRRGIEIKIVSPFEISGEAWMNALVELARRQG